MNSYGYFDDEAREYVITDPRTPVKWINYLGSLDFGGFIDQTGGILLCRQDPALNRITRYRAQGPPSEFRGTTLYLRTPLVEGGYEVSSPFHVPALTPLDRFECHVGLGYSTFISEAKGLRMEVRAFIPPGESVLIQQVWVTNVGEEPKSVNLIPVVEYTHPDALKQLVNADWVPQTMQSYLYEEEDGLKVLSQAPFMFKDNRVNYFTSNLPVDSFDTDRQVFLGENGYGGWVSPGGLQLPELSNSLALRGDNIAALMLHLGQLEPGENREAILLLGQAGSVESALPIIHRLRDTDAVEEAFTALTKFWDELLSVAYVQTPDADMDRMLNIHNPRQCYITMNWSRYLSLYQLGFGARGMGFRDSSQDVMGALSGSPQAARELLVKLLQVQRPDGAAMHQFNPLTMVANMGDSANEEDRPHYYSDDHLWSVLAVCEYLKETGDFKFLKEKVAYYEKDKQGKPLETGTVWNHLKRAIQFTHDNIGKHGLPLAGFADWNDTVNLSAGAESLFTANLYGWAVKELIALAKLLGKDKTTKRFEKFYKEMKSAINKEAWDGDWYIRYFDPQGKPIGSKQNEQGQIFANAQSWAILSGFAPEERAVKALDSVFERLNTANGIKLSTPGYNGFDPEKGGVTTYPPGAKENGGIFLHANPWVMIAETKLGHGNRAYAYYRQINPAIKNDRIDEFECEPYVYPQNILGDEHPQFGLARNSWLTGTASWVYQAGMKYILGIRPDYDGLQIDPCIPEDWDGFEVTRKFRGASYSIHVTNPDHVSRGVKLIIIDGQFISGATLPVFEDGKVHDVEVFLG
jgi:cellobiose phosphorylase